MHPRLEGLLQQLDIPDGLKLLALLPFELLMLHVLQPGLPYMPQACKVPAIQTEVPIMLP